MNRTRLFWLMCDQGIFALTNFISNVMFARWLTPSDYGLFSTTYSLFILLSTLHNAFILEPLLVQSPQIAIDRMRSYVIAIAWQQTIIIFVAAIIGGICYEAFMLLKMPAIAESSLWTALAGSMVLTLITARRICLAFLSTRVSALVGAFYLLAMISTGFAMHTLNLITWYGLWFIMGIWSLICSTLIIFLINRATVCGEHYSMRELMSFQSGYARWAFVAGINPWLRYDGIYLFLLNFIGLEAVARARVLLVLGNPLSQINTAMNASWLISFSDDRVKRREQRLLPTAVPYVLLVLVITILATLFSRPIMLYTFGEHYESVAWLLPLVFLAVGCSGTSLIIESMLKSRDATITGYIPAAMSCVGALFGGFVLIPHFNLLGGILSIVLASMLSLITAVILIQRRPERVANVNENAHRYNEQAS